MSGSLLSKRFLFRVSVPCRYRHPVWEEEGRGLDKSYRLVSLAELENQPTWADVRAAWSEEGLAFSVHVSGKKQDPWCRITRFEDSDGVQIWIDTRDVHNIHRATRFCHGFLFMPLGGGSALADPVAQWIPIQRAREHPRAIKRDRIAAKSRMQLNGYLLEAFIAADALTGFDPQEHPRLGFNYAVTDREFGEQTLSAGSPMPYQNDPSLWATLELVK